MFFFLRLKSYVLRPKLAIVDGGVAEAIVVAALLLGVFGCSSRKIERVEWPVMNTVAAVQWQGDGAGMDEAVATVKSTFADIERLLNAHDPNSEISRLKDKSDATILCECDAMVHDCYRMALRLRKESGGVFNPRWAGTNTFDLGAIAKGFAVDLAAERIIAATNSNRILIDLGGNLRAVGGDWETAVYSTDQNPKVFTLSNGVACATSGKYFRGDHIRDGRNGSSVENKLYSVTVVYPKSAMLADGLSTIMFILGREKGDEFIRRHFPYANVIWLDNSL